MTEAIEQVTSRLEVCTERMVPSVVRQRETDLHDEQVFVVISQNGVPVTHAVEIIMLERT